LVIHAKIVLGHVNNAITRSLFFNGVGYRIGGQRYTLNIIEHGILRNNKTPPYKLIKILSKDDIRLRYSIESDPCIHFTLVCGAKSCPAINVYTPINIEQALTEATEIACNEIELDTEKKKR